MAKKPLEWNVFRHDFNKKEIVTYNVLNNGIIDELKKKKEKCDSKEKFSEELKRTMMYYFWCKSEHEVVVCSWPVYVDMKELDRLNSEKEENIKNYGREPYRLWADPTIGSKIDIYKQLEINWDKFLDYVWENI